MYIHKFISFLHETLLKLEKYIDSHTHHYLDPTIFSLDIIIFSNTDIHSIRIFLNTILKNISLLINVRHYLPSILSIINNIYLTSCGHFLSILFHSNYIPFSPVYPSSSLVSFIIWAIQFQIHSKAFYDSFHFLDSKFYLDLHLLCSRIHEFFSIICSNKLSFILI